MKIKWIRRGSLVLVFLVTLLVSNAILNRGSNENTIAMESPTLPKVSFTTSEVNINQLAGYTDEMDITAMRDTITPVAADGSLVMHLNLYGQTLQKLSYEVLALDGKESCLQNTAEGASEGDIQLDLSGALSTGETEKVLKVTVSLEDKDVYYYTRIESDQDLSLGKCISFSKQLHEKTFDKTNREYWDTYLEPGEDSDNTTYQTVDIHSNSYHICWGDMAPEIISDVDWSIKESNSVYTSLLAEYRVQCLNGEDTDIYNVREFFRVRYNDGKMYLLNYNRKMNEVFEGTKAELDEKGIVLGIRDADVDYKVNNSGTIVSFVQARELWQYDSKNKTFSKVFSFDVSTAEDDRSRLGEHNVQILSMDDSGNMIFGVYGYMNSGKHEGQVGVAVYSFEKGKNLIEEKAFVQSKKAFAIAQDELGKMVYCNEAEQKLYILAGGILHEVDLKKNEIKNLEKDLQEDEYVISADGHQIAYQTDGNRYTAKSVKVLNFETGDSFDVEASEGEAIQPLGFVDEDFICGFRRAEDEGVTGTGQEEFPMYRMEIRDKDNKTVKEYQPEGIYLSDIIIEDTLVTLNRFTKKENVYIRTSQDFVTNTEEKRAYKVALETFTTELKEKQMRFTFAKDLESLAVKKLIPNIKVNEKALAITFEKELSATEKYYVYGIGELEGIYSKPTYAIQKAEQLSGVVISSEQKYIWEKGNRDLAYFIETKPFQKADGQSSLDACLEYMKKYDANQLDLSGCSLNQVLYIINKGMPMIAMTSTDHAVLIVGYNLDNVDYIDPDTGEEKVVSVDEMNKTMNNAGNMFIGFAR